MKMIPLLILLFLAPTPSLSAPTTLTVTPKTLTKSGDSVSIQWSNVPSPSKLDWLGIYSPPDSRHDHFIGYKFLSESPTWASGSGSISIPLTNLRSSYSFRIFRWADSEINPKKQDHDHNPLPGTAHLLASAGSVGFETGRGPEQVHLAFTEDASEMRVMFLAEDGEKRYAKYGEKKDQMGHVAATIVERYERDQMCDKPANSSIGWRDPGWIFDAVIKGLKKGVRYYYKVGSDSKGWSETHSFVSRNEDSNETIAFLFGDMGAATPYTTFERTQDESISTMKWILRDIEALGDKPAFVSHIGDISYARGYSWLWDEFFALIEPVASRVAYHVCIGNHEYDWPLQPWKPDWSYTVYGTDGGGECGVPYSLKFHMPGNSLEPTGTRAPATRNLYYSFDMGVVHFVYISTETNFLRGSNQYNFIKHDLKSVDRKKTPFVVVQGHRPMYTTSNENRDAPLRNRMLEHLEPLFVENNVTLALWGHVHRYERFCPLNNFTCGSMGMDGEHSEAFPVHIVIGMAGQDWQPIWQPRPDHPDDPVFPQPMRSLYRGGEFGYTRLVATKEKLTLSYVGNHDGEVHDMVEIPASGQVLSGDVAASVKESETTSGSGSGSGSGPRGEFSKSTFSWFVQGASILVADLLNQLSSLNHAEHALSTVRSAVSSLQSSVRRVRSELSDPYKSIKSKTIQLSNLHRTTELLQHTIRGLRLSKKLRDLIAAAEAEPEKLDLTKAAQLHCEIVTMCKEYDLSGIDVINEELLWVKEVGEKLRNEAMKVLEGGMEGLNQAQVGTGLQVFYNLGELKVTVEHLVNKYKNMGVKSVNVALDMKVISGGGAGFGPGGIRGSGMPQIGGGVKAREGLWQRMGTCMDQLHSVVVAVWHLQRVLSKKRDPFTHVLLLDEVIQEGDPMLTDRVWEGLVKAFANQMKSAFTASSFVKEIFTSGYPKLLSMIENLLERISRETDVKGVLPAISPEGKGQMIAAIEIFQTAFLTLCLTRLSDLVNSVFPMSSRGSVPSKEQISRILSRIQEEIEAVHMDGRLTLLVLREIGKVLILVAERAEYQISTGPEARQIPGPATSAQIKNFALCQHLQEIYTRMSSMITGLPPIAAEVLSPSLGTIYGVACDSVTSLFQAMIDGLESCILQIHDQNFSVLGMDAAMDNNASPYMEELQKCILHFRSEFLSRLLPSSANTTTAGTETICTRLVRSMASRVLIFFIRHASLVRPLSESGKLRMARDMAELELAVGQNLFPVEQLGTPYRALRAFRPLIFLETSQLGASPLLQDLPPSVILHHLYSRGPDELQSPLQRNKLTPLQYSLWLDSQGEDQIWKGIKATLDDYAANVRARGDKEFSPVYPLMLQLGSALSVKAPGSQKS